MAASTDSARARDRNRVCGRFAPSPTGPQHFGSLVAALASYLDARHRGGEWLVRIEDLDPPRETPGASADILRALEGFGFEWDRAVRYQSRELGRYAAALERLSAAGAAYPCACSRREIADSAIQGVDGPVYPGTCRAGIPGGRAPRAWRIRAIDAPIAFDDGVFGPITQNVAAAVGDFVLKRADGLFAYQLAVVLDDADQAITHVVRGADLLDSTARQIMLQRILGLATPSYLHVPVAVNDVGDKLSKQSLAAALDIRAAQPTLIAALRFLGQNAPPDLRAEPPREILRWAIRHWNTRAIPRRRTLAAPGQAQ
ncbi:MAG: tRNA glutamyl-Q(34) synthetase GluQRS [Betaproteobacteria bacterium]|nr:MAG: tRNA glutamyl-Q(34) synthetase GluQRS [Betaproteobacteria bacterium]